MAMWEFILTVLIYFVMQERIRELTALNHAMVLNLQDQIDAQALAMRQWRNTLPADCLIELYDLDVQYVSNQTFGRPE